MFDSILSAVERFAGAYPGVFALLVVAVGVPIITGAASFADVWLARHAPVALAMMRALGFDPKRFLAILTSKALESRKLPVPPEVRALTVERIEKADSKRPPSPPTAPPAVLILCLALASCGSTDPAKTAANATREVGIAGAELLRVTCTEPYQRATTRAEVDRLDALGCQHAAAAYESMRAAHTTIVAVVRAVDSGQCVGVSRSSRDCNIAGSYVDLAKAASQWAAAVERIGAGQ